MTRIASVMPKWRFDAAEVAIPPNWDVEFVNPKADEELIRACQGAECLLVPAGFQNVSARVLESITHIKLVQSAGAGFDGIDSTAARKLQIPVANVPGQNARSVAEYTIGLIIALQRRIYIADQEVKAGNYTKVRQRLFKEGLTDIYGSSIGLVGLGSIGGEVAKILSYMGASVSYYSHTRKSPALEEELSVTYKPLKELLADSDVVSVHIPLTEDTKGFIGEQELMSMKRQSLLINTARGEVVDQTALARMLEEGRISGAALDVMAPEPPSAAHPLLNLSKEGRDRLLITPHIAGVTVKCFQAMLTGAVENIQRVLSGKRPKHIVNGL